MLAFSDHAEIFADSVRIMRTLFENLGFHDLTSIWTAFIKSPHD